MKKLVHTGNIGFDLCDWETESIHSVYAGADCIMAITDDGRVLQKVTDTAVSARTEYWTRVSQIAVSKYVSGLAIGLICDGTCMISKRPLRRICGPDSNLYAFDAIHNVIKTWQNIVQVEVSDSFFALDSDGYVHISPLDRYTEQDYREVASWKNVQRIITGSQNSIFGITADGRVLCAGANLKNGPHGNISARTTSLTDVVDIVTTGSECEEIYFAFRDGSVRDLNGKTIPVKTPRSASCRKVFDGFFNFYIVILSENSELIQPGISKAAPLLSGNGEVASFAVGSVGFDPFVLAVVNR